MIVHERKCSVSEENGGVRRREIRLTMEIDPSGKERMLRYVGRSFFEPDAVRVGCTSEPKAVRRSVS